MTLGSRIAAARQQRGWSQKKLGDAVNKSAGTIWSWESGRTEPTRQDIQNVAVKLGIPLGQIEDFGHELRAFGIIQVPLISWVSAGLASETGDANGPASEFLSVGDLPPGDYFATDVRGDSMDRVSPEGSRIIVNAGEKSLISGRFYVFSRHGETTYKVFQGDPVRRLEPYSTNPANKTIFIVDSDWVVIGRVVRSYIDFR